jgi:hypothetical protein
MMIDVQKNMNATQKWAKEKSLNNLSLIVRSS